MSTGAPCFPDSVKVAERVHALCLQEGTWWGVFVFIEGWREAEGSLWGEGTSLLQEQQLPQAVRAIVLLSGAFIIDGYSSPGFEPFLMTVSFYKLLTWWTNEDFGWHHATGDQEAAEVGKDLSAAFLTLSRVTFPTCLLCPGSSQLPFH